MKDDQKSSITKEIKTKNKRGVGGLLHLNDKITSIQKEMKRWI